MDGEQEPMDEGQRKYIEGLYRDVVMFTTSDGTRIKAALGSEESTEENQRDEDGTAKGRDHEDGQAPARDEGQAPGHPEGQSGEENEESKEADSSDRQNKADAMLVVFPNTSKGIEQRYAVAQDFWESHDYRIDEDTDFIALDAGKRENGDAAYLGLILPVRTPEGADYPELTVLQEMAKAKQPAPGPHEPDHAHIYHLRCHGDWDDIMRHTETSLELRETAMKLLEEQEKLHPEPEDEVYHDAALPGTVGLKDILAEEEEIGAHSEIDPEPKEDTKILKELYRKAIVCANMPERSLILFAKNAVKDRDRAARAFEQTHGYQITKEDQCVISDCPGFWVPQDLEIDGMHNRVDELPELAYLKQKAQTDATPIIARATDTAQLDKALGQAIKRLYTGVPFN